jgi:hypothetical protein
VTGAVVLRLKNERDQEKREKWKAVEEQQRLQEVEDSLKKRAKELKVTRR